jgi:hypothetical protein
MIPENLKKNYFNAITLTKTDFLEFQGSSPPSVFVSSLNYPKVSVGPVSLTAFSSDASFYDMPEKWFGLTKQEIIALRKQLVNAIKKFKVNAVKDPSYELINIQEIALSSMQTELDIKLNSIPRNEMLFSNHNAPTTNFALLKNFSFVSNPFIDRKVDYFYNDFDLKAEEAVQKLYEYGLQVSQIQKIFSVGALGIQKNRKLVPTKWSITAVDDIVSKNLIEKIKDFQCINEFQLFESNYMHNHFFVILMPFNFSFEMLECWIQENQNNEQKIAQDFEFSEGRTDYASSITGAYYAARLAVTEFLYSIKRNAAILIIREISPEYDQPLGVWQIRENVRHALKQKPRIFFDLNILFKFLESKLKISANYYKKKSKLIDFFFKQKKITDF